MGMLKEIRVMTAAGPLFVEMGAGHGMATFRSGQQEWTMAANSMDDLIAGANGILARFAIPVGSVRIGHKLFKAIESELEALKPYMAKEPPPDVPLPVECGPGITNLAPKRPDNTVAWLDEDLLCADAD